VPAPAPLVALDFIGERRPLYDTDDFLSAARPGRPIGEACSARGLSETPMPASGFFDGSVASPGKPTAPSWLRREGGETCVVADRERDDTPSCVEVLGCREAGLGAALPEGGETWVVVDRARDDTPSCVELLGCLEAGLEAALAPPPIAS